ncbi:MAG: hypothetical protein DRN20_02195 [Thermoplasmata archaeon]|nr:MAG: hypothetical protein DRN20_02195 [Thermoplasmata archaeon]
MEYFIPGDKFPAVSLTGNYCALSCEHCMGKYLRGMHHVRNDNDLIKLARLLEEKGAHGMLISGGCDPSGRVPLSKYRRPLKEIKKSTSLIIAAHPGFISAIDIQPIVDLIDVLFFDVVGDDRIFREIYHLPFDIGFMEDMIRVVSDSGIRYISPHITFGLYWGRESGERTALRMLAGMRFNSLIINAVLSTPGTAFSRISLDREGFIDFVVTARRFFRSKRIILGCMRPRDFELEDAVAPYVDGIAMPTLCVRKKYPGTIRAICCGIPPEIYQNMKN